MQLLDKYFRGFAWKLCQKGAIILPLSHLSRNSLLLHYFSLFSLLCCPASDVNVEGGEIVADQREFW